MPETSNCPCGSNNDYSSCCEPIISGQQLATSAEQLMRARYSAHAKIAIDFLEESTHPDCRRDYDQEQTRKWAAESDWLSLEIGATEAGQEQDDKGTVTFIARYRDQAGIHNHHEISWFEKSDGRWYFRRGETVKATARKNDKIGRNDPCSCGSGKKFKKCCGKN